MNVDLAFAMANKLALTGWVVLILLPRWRWSARLVCPVIVVGLFAIAYTVFLLPQIGRSEGGFGTLEQVAVLFANDKLLLAGWLHYLAFDLFIGSWEVRDSQRHGIHHLFVVPCLVLTFMLGPIGLLCYLVLRSVKLKTLWMEPARA
ncbi:MAG: DUF4281 domain-containing protein [Gammaproteobacteria bacterium]|nr:DUF4281 domain-containing protein [Gammaproteobacteria bacterium]